MDSLGEDLIQAMGESVAHAKDEGPARLHSKPMPPLHSDAEAEEFVEKADLSEYDLSGFKPVRFEVGPETVEAGSDHDGQ